MDFDIQLPSGQTLPGVGAVLVLLLIVRHPSSRHSGQVIEVFMDPLFFLGCCAGLIRQLAQKSLLQAPDVIQDTRITLPKTIELKVPSISINKIGDEADAELDLLISRALAGLNTRAPELCTEGVNGTYFLRDVDGKITAIFKPEDEELSSPNNPKTQQDDSKRGILPGEAAVREVVASRLNDRFGGYFKVPRTGLVSVTHPTFGNVDGIPRVKVGSLQEFVDSDGPVGDIGPQSFPTDEVHRIALLDLILHNTDRHEGNILYRNTPSGVKLFPIDHGFSLPDRVGGGWFDWMNYPQAKKEFGPEALRVVDEMDPRKLCEELSEGLFLRPECRRTMELSCLLVKKGVKAGLTPRQLGTFASRRNPKEISAFEVLIDDCEKMSGDFMENASALMDERLHLFRM